MPNVFDEVENEVNPFDYAENELKSLSSEDISRQLAPAALNLQARLAGYMQPGTELTTAFAESARHPVQSAGKALDYAGNVARAIPADVAWTLSRNPQNLFKDAPGAGNIAAALKGESLPVDEVVSDAASYAHERGEFPVAATVAETSQGLAATAPLLIGIGIAPKAVQTLVGAGFTIEMLRALPKTGAEFFAEMSLPQEQRDPQKLAQLLSAGVQELGFGALGTAHGLKMGRKAIEKYVEPNQTLGVRSMLETPEEAGQRADLIEELNKVAPETAKEFEKSASEPSSVLSPKELTAPGQPVREQTAPVLPEQATKVAPVKFIGEQGLGKQKYYEVTEPFTAPDAGDYKPGNKVSEAQLKQWGMEAPSETIAPPVEAKTGELFQGTDQPFNLAGEKGLDAERVAAEKKAKADADKAAAEFEEKNQREMFEDPENVVLEGDPFGVQGAIASGVPPLAPVAAPVQLTPKSQRQIITDLAKGLKVPIRFGRLTTNKFAGYFKSVANLIGAKKANQIPLVSHEVGHKLDSTFKLSGDRSIASELNVLGDPATPGSYSSWTKSKTNKYKMGEGVAEFTRLWLTDPPKALRDAPNTHRAFEAALNANKDFGDVMRTAQQDIAVWRTAEPQARLRSHISIGSNPNKTPYTMSQLTRDLIDDLHFGRLAVDDAQKMAGRTLNPSENFYLLARNLRGSYGMADTFIRDGVTDFKTKSVQLGTGLEDALKPVSGRINDFRDWIVAKQAQELHSKGKQTGLVDADVNAVASRFDADPAFQEAFTKVKAWNDAMLQYAVDAGLVTADGAAAMRRMNQDYVPFHRVFEIGAGEAPAVEGMGTGRGLNVGKPGSLKGRHGSPRDIVDPLETMVRNAYAVITASEKAAINLAVADLSRSPGMGRWVEKIAVPQQNIKVVLEKLRKQLEDAGADLTGVPDDLLLNFFQNSGRANFGENTIKVVRDGKPEFYRLNKDLFDTFHALDLEDSGKLIRILSSPAQLLRSGVTLAPDFALANALRDTFSAAILSKYNAYPFEVTMRGLGAMINNPKLVAEWAAAGGKNSIEANYFDRTKLQSFLKDKITKDLTPAEQAMVIAKSPLTALRWLTSISEEATRIGEYQKAFNSLTKSGMPEGEARRLAAFESRDRQDFAKGGAKTKIVRHMAAFWNAQLQANVRLAQSFKERPFQTIGKGLLYITTAKLLEQAINWDDKDYWDRPQWERDLFFLIPIGKGKDGHTRFIRIPTPFEPGVIFGTFPGRMLQWAKENNSDAIKDFPELILKQSVPNPMPQTVTTVFADFLSGKKGWDIWRGRQVVPESVANLPPEMQWTEQNSLTARHLGKAIGYSPIKIDHIISSSAGGVGQALIHQVSDRAISLVTGEKPTAQGKVPGGRFITTPAAVSSRARDDFYATLEQMRTEKARKKAGGTPKLDIGRWGDIFESSADELSNLRKQILATQDPVQKQRLSEQQLKIVRELMQRYQNQK